MAYVVITQAEGITPELYDAVNERLFAQGDPPREQQLHTAGFDERGLRVVDVWDSIEAHDRFRDERLVPAIAEVTQEKGIEPSGPPQTTVYEAHFVAVRPGVGQ